MRASSQRWPQARRRRLLARVPGVSQLAVGPDWSILAHSDLVGPQLLRCDSPPLPAWPQWRVAPLALGALSAEGLPTELAACGLAVALTTEARKGGAGWRACSPALFAALCAAAAAPSAAAAATAATATAAAKAPLLLWLVVRLRLMRDGR